MSSTIAEIVARPHRDVGYVLFIESLPTAFTNRSELAGSGVQSGRTRRARANRRKDCTVGAPESHAATAASLVRRLTSGGQGWSAD